MIRLAERIGGALTRVEAGLTGVADLLLLLLLVLINVEVVARYGFNTSTLIADESGGFLFAWGTILGAPHLPASGKRPWLPGPLDKNGTPRAHPRPSRLRSLR